MWPSFVLGNLPIVSGIPSSKNTVSRWSRLLVLQLVASIFISISNAHPYENIEKRLLDIVAICVAFSLKHLDCHELHGMLGSSFASTLF
jgi:hypothetical protein